MISKKQKTASYEAGAGEAGKVLLLYSGGLDTSCMLKWIQEEYGTTLLALTVDVGQKCDDLDAVKKKALAFGAEKAFVVDAKKEFAEEYVAKAIKANALYEGAYPLSTALARPLQAKIAVETAAKEGADAIAHGCTGKGNDQVRLDAAILALNPGMKIIAPVREWGMTREQEVLYAEKHGIPIPGNSRYSVDENLWGRSIECGELEDPETEPCEDAFELAAPLGKTPDEPEYASLEFAEGIPKALNGKEMELHDLIAELNKIAGKHGVGVFDHMEDRTIGLKSREVYECPAAACILSAHKELEKTVCTIHENQTKPLLDEKWAFLAYAGLWFDPLMSALNAFNEKINEKVCGEVKLKLFKGGARIVGRSSPYALYDKALATYSAGQTFNQKASPGFIELWSLQTRMANQIAKKAKTD